MPDLTEKEQPAGQQSGVTGSRRYRSRRERYKAKRRKGFLILLVLAVLGVIAAAVFIIPLLENPAVMLADTQLEIRRGEKDSFEFVWTPGKHAAEYRVVISDAGYGAAAGDVLVDRICKDPSCLVSAAELSAQTKTRPVRVEITARKFFDFLKRPSKNGEEVPPESQAVFECFLCEPEIRNQQASVDVEQQDIHVSWNGWEGDSYAVYLRSEDGSSRILLHEIRGEGSTSAELAEDIYDLTIPYGQGAGFQIPADDRLYILEIETARDNGHVLFPGASADVATLTRGDLMSKTINLQCDRLENNRFCLRWNDTGSIAYRVEVKRPGREVFEKIGLVDGRQETVYEPEEHFKACREYTFRITGITDGDELVQDQIDAKFAEIYDETDAGSGELEVHRAEGDNTGQLTVFTEPDALYASIWPVKKLDLYANADKAKVVGSAPVGECLCVLGEVKDEGLFRVRIDDQEGYIDSSYCMINLPDYLGELCQYDIPNSYASIYMVHDFYIPDVTARVIPGYENVLLEDGTFVVPLLYPVAERLVDAARSLYEAGYRIEINDSFRPYCATRYIYDETNEILTWQLPETRFWDLRTTIERYLSNGRVADEVPDEARAPKELELEALEENGGEMADPETAAGTDGNTAETPAAQTPADPPAETAGEKPAEADPAGVEVQGEGAVPDGEETPLLEDTEDNHNTYYWEMTAGSYNLGSFLAKAASRHNLGVAMDMTIVRLSDPSEPLPMQTRMHDLSHYSAMGQNNDNANILKEYLTGAGFAMISSEWWHFQDNEATTRLHPPIVENGVSIKGWKKDDKGWRYLDDAGRAVIDEVVTIDGRSYIFDLDGYADR